MERLTVSNKEAEKSADALGSKTTSREDPLADTLRLTSADSPHGVDRRSFLMRSAVGGAAAVMTGCSVSPEQRTAKAVETAPAPAQAPSTPPLAPELNVVQKGKGPVLTTLDEFYKVGPGPSSSHTIGPMRITYDFYQRAT